VIVYEELIDRVESFTGARDISSRTFKTTHGIHCCWEGPSPAPRNSFVEAAVAPAPEISVADRTP